MSYTQMTLLRQTCVHIKGKMEVKEMHAVSDISVAEENLVCVGVSEPELHSSARFV